MALLLLVNMVLELGPSAELLAGLRDVVVVPTSPVGLACAYTKHIIAITESCTNMHRKNYKNVIMYYMLYLNTVIVSRM